MAKRFRRFGRFARRSARLGRRAYRFGKRHGVYGKGAGSLLHLDAMAYGAVRPTAVSLIDKVAPKILGNLDSEVKMALADWLLGKYMGGAVRNFAHKGLIVENFLVGETVGAPLISGFAGGGSSSSSTLFG
jgi:hypothetical protein